MIESRSTSARTSAVRSGVSAHTTRTELRRPSAAQNTSVGTSIPAPLSSKPQNRIMHTPDMPHPVSRSVEPTVVIGGVPLVEEPKKKRLFALNTNAPRVRTIRAQKRTPFPLGMMFLLLLCTGLFMYMVQNFVEINEYSMHLDQMQSRLEELNKQQQSLELQLENRNNMSAIADMAENDLGMVKLDEVEKEYLNDSSEDKIELSQPDNDEAPVSTFSVLLNAIIQNFRDLAEYID